MYVEDLIAEAYFKLFGSFGSWEKTIIASFYSQTSNNSPLTEKQSKLILRILKKSAPLLSEKINQDVQPFIDNPIYKYPIRALSKARRISIVSGEPYQSLTKMIKAEFPYDQEKIIKIRSARDNVSMANWDSQNKFWVLSLTEKNVLLILDIIKDQEFDLDDEFKEYATRVQQVLDNVENYLPMLAVEGKNFVFKNGDRALPACSATDTLDAVFQARKRGILVWDDAIETYLQSDLVSPVTRNIISHPPEKWFYINSDNHKLDQLADIINYLGPCLFVVPGGSEQETLERVHALLNYRGVSNEDISVMFRLSGEEGKPFSNYVRENKLNSPIGDNTHSVIISGKFPKPIIKSKIKFNSVISLCTLTVHYTVREFISNQENVIFYSNSTPQRTLDFGIM